MVLLGNLIVGCRTISIAVEAMKRPSMKSNTFYTRIKEYELNLAMYLEKIILLNPSFIRIDRNTQFITGFGF
jgi:hypothetical protein